ncbi:hypothetical protein [Draconibacterium halophilum]|uniref:MG2 domain-containing protein n=1 Tax=Draconibacterium halophilum TaxID=2706887 RepID=A0A6C0RHJ5_9BACT|nr:hypothetical protein [Draconibacterium halophilum]QIA09302.1 hypothetical protein G0Q07_17010 [Draconibacterium halophilum]
MSRALKILLLVIYLLAGVKAMAQNTVSNELVLFTDRDFCISGDTLWIKIYVPKEVHNLGNIVRMQLESQSGNLIASRALKCNDTHAEGFIAVPDSLQTGLYFVHAFFNAQRNSTNLKCIGRSVYVYNRFEEEIDRLPVLETRGAAFETENAANKIDISVEDKKYSRRDNVKGVINAQVNEFVYLVASARMIEPFSHANTGFLNFGMKNLNSTIPAFSEKEGILLSGKISNKKTGEAANELVLLSVTGNETYFDYYYPDSTGVFHFLLGNAMGTANVILQPLTIGEKLFDVDVIPNFMSGVQQLKFDTTFVNPKQAENIENSIKGTFFNKLFRGVSISSNDAFKMSNPYGMPFYGWPDNHIVLDEFIDLPNFKEISRELLIGLQYRDRNAELTFRMLNYGQDKFFDAEPLRLINGIPVFKNSFFQDLRSTEIASIDLVKSERVFGDVRFKGVLAVSLNDKSNSWLAQQPNIFQLKVPCIEYPKHANYSSKSESRVQIDTRHQFLNELVETDGSWPFHFQLSDVKGDLEIKVEAITKSGELYRTSKIISVQ